SLWRRGRSRRGRLLRQAWQRGKDADQANDHKGNPYSFHHSFHRNLAFLALSPAGRNFSSPASATDRKNTRTERTASPTGRIAGSRCRRSARPLRNLLAPRHAHNFGGKTPEVFQLQSELFGLFVGLDFDLGQPNEGAAAAPSLVEIDLDNR